MADFPFQTGSGLGPIQNMIMARRRDSQNTPTPRPKNNQFFMTAPG